MEKNLIYRLALVAVVFVLGAYLGYSWRWSTDDSQLLGASFVVDKESEVVTVKIMYRKPDGPVQVGYIIDEAERTVRLKAKTVPGGIACKPPHTIVINFQEIGLTKETADSAKLLFRRNGVWVEATLKTQ
ncbi:MAG: hypothetical protein KF812_06505 [Fimbriimonadaceae bacterium]|nr:hypothetical protein [Fimbriimonadaceae bacterium]